MDLVEQDYERVASLLKDFNITGKRIMITGATGMIGSFIVSSLLHADEVYGLGNTVVGLCRNAAKLKSLVAADSSFLEIHTIPDIADFIDDFPVDYVIHTACNTTSSYMMSNPVETVDGIYRGTRAVLEYARKVKPTKVIFLSSMEVYGEISEETVVDEDSLLGNLTVSSVRSGYPMAKRLSENLAVAYSAEYRVPVCILRLAQTFGVVTKPDTRYFYQLIESAVKGNDIILRTKGDKINNFCYLSDAVRAMIYIMHNGADGEIYNVSDRSSTMTIREMAELTADRLADGKIKAVVELDEVLASKYAKTSKYIMDSTKLNKLGWKAEVHLEDALRRNVEYQTSL